MNFFVKKTKILKKQFFFFDALKIIYFFKFKMDTKEYSIALKISIYDDESQKDYANTYLNICLNIQILRGDSIYYKVQKEILQRTFYLLLHFIKHDLIFFLKGFSGKKFISCFTVKASVEILNNLYYLYIFGNNNTVHINNNSIICRFSPKSLVKSFFHGYKINKFILREE